MSAKREHLEYIDVLNVLAALSVVALHCNGCFWEGPVQGRSWVSANFIETALYWPVPIFFMITGATLLNYADRMSTKDYLVRRFMRTGIPFLVWSIIGFFWYAAANASAGIATDWSPTSIIDGIVSTRFVAVYWFFPPLFGIYLAIPIISVIRSNAATLRYALIAGVLCVFTLPLLCTIIGISWNGSLTPPPVAGYMTYVLLGWYLRTNQLTPRQRYCVYVLGVTGWLVQMVGTLVLSSPETGINSLFKGYTNLPALLQSVAVFVFFQHLRYEGTWKTLANVCRRLSALTFGVYLTHWFVINAVGRSGIIDAHSIVWRTLGAMAVFVVCSLFTWVVQHIPVLRRAMP